MKIINLKEAKRKRLEKEFEDDPEALKKIDEMRERFRKESKKWHMATKDKEEPLGPALGPKSEFDMKIWKKRIINDLQESMEDED